MTPHFTDPFRYVPHPLVRKAAGEVIERLDRMISDVLVPEEVAKGFTDGKMLGVLICKDGSCLAAFSGSAGGRSIIDGFVPPIFDLTEDGGHYRRHEAEISHINEDIEEIELTELLPLERRLEEASESREEELMKAKSRKKEARSIAESRFASGEIQRTRNRWKETISGLEGQLQEVRDRIRSLKKLRAMKSDELQRWIFGQYIVSNAEGSKASILEIFQNQGIMPPGGTGDCAAPKLLDHAYRNGLEPLAMGEFWYGKSPDTAVRTHGHFYPSCTSKCGPLLSYMMQGLAVSGHGCVEWTCHPRLGGACVAGGGPWNTPCPETATADKIYESAPEGSVIYEDDEIIAASKPSGMPSVPGLDGRISLQEWLEKEMQSPVYSVHRLDMDTSGIIIFAKTPQAEANLKKQFEEHNVRKTYIARLSPADTHRFAEKVPVLKAGDKGRIELPLSPDYDERPRQKADKSQGKPSVTGYEVISDNEDGTTDILLYPQTGRTHQLRVHSAHIRGLCRPILGDLLYGGCGSVWHEVPSCTRLHLHAYSITFRHPVTGKDLTFSSSLNSWISGD